MPCFWKVATLQLYDYSEKQVSKGFILVVRLGVVRAARWQRSHSHGRPGAGLGGFGDFWIRSGQSGGRVKVRWDGQGQVWEVWGDFWVRSGQFGGRVKVRWDGRGQVWEVWGDFWVRLGQSGGRVILYRKGALGRPGAGLGGFGDFWVRSDMTRRDLT